MVAFGRRKSAKLINLCQAQSSPRSSSCSWQHHNLTPLSVSPPPLHSSLPAKESAKIIIITNPAEISKQEGGREVGAGPALLRLINKRVVGQQEHREKGGEGGTRGDCCKRKVLIMKIKNN